MPATYDNLATSTLSSPTTTISFTNVSQSYTDFRLIITCPQAGTGTAYAGARLNNHNVYSWYDGWRNNSGSISSGYDGRSLFSSYGTVNTGTNYSNLFIFDFNLYTDTSMNQSVLLSHSENGTSIAAQISSIQGGYASITTNITSVQAYSGGDWAAGTKATLYGILRA